MNGSLPPTPLNHTRRVSLLPHLPGTDLRPWIEHLSGLNKQDSDHDVKAVFDTVYQLQDITKERLIAAVDENREANEAETGRTIQRNRSRSSASTHNLAVPVSTSPTGSTQYSSSPISPPSSFIVVSYDEDVPSAPANTISPTLNNAQEEKPEAGKRTVSNGKLKCGDCGRDYKKQSNFERHLYEKHLHARFRLLKTAGLAPKTNYLRPTSREGSSDGFA